MVGYTSTVAVVNCPKCGSAEIRAAATNGHDPAHVTRKRSCADCGHAWFTVELPVSTAVVGWERVNGKGQSKPVLRVPVDLAVGEGAV